MMICLATTVMVVSCKKPKDGETGAQGPAGPSLQGNVQGFVQLYDQYGTRSYVKLDSSMVSQDGSSSVRYTDSTGKFTFNGLNTGIYNFSVTGRAGYAADKLQGIEITGNGTIDRDVKLSQIPTWSVSVVTAIDTIIGANHSLKLRVNLPVADPKARQVAVFINTNSAVSSLNYLWNYTITVPANATTVNSVLAQTSTFLGGDNLPSGSTIYVIVYPAAVGYANNSSYVDYTNDRTVFNALNLNSSAVSQTAIQ